MTHHRGPEEIEKNILVVGSLEVAPYCGNWQALNQEIPQNDDKRATEFDSTPTSSNTVSSLLFINVCSVVNFPKTGGLPLL